MAVSDNLDHPIASADGAEASGLLVIDQDLLICQISLAAAGLFDADGDDLIGHPIQMLLGDQPEIHVLYAQLRGLGDPGPVSWQAQIDWNQHVHIRGFVDSFSVTPSSRLIVLTISRIVEQKNRMVRPSLPQAFKAAKSLSARTRSVPVILLPLGIVGLGVMISSGQSRSVDEGESTVAIEQPDDQRSSSMAEEASTRRFVGQVHPGASVAGVAPFDGTIIDISAPNFGVAVEKDDLLVTLDPGEEGATAQREAKIALIEAKSELLKLQNWSTGSEMREMEQSLRDVDYALKRATLERDRSKALLDEGIIAANEYETAVEAVRSAESQRSSAKNRRDDVMAQASTEHIEIAEERLDIAQTAYDSLEAAQTDREVRAPISGILLPAPSDEKASNVFSVGGDVEKGRPLFVIGDVSELFAQTSVSEFDIELIKPGQAASIGIPAQPDLHLEGEIVSVSQLSSAFGNPELTGGGYSAPPARYDVTVKILGLDPKLGEQLNIGMTVDVDVDTTPPSVPSR